MELLFNFCESKAIAPNELYVLWCIENKKRPKILNLYAELRHLVSGNYLEVDYSITAKGREILGQFKKFYKTDKVTLNPEELTLNIAKYLELFPPGKLPSGKSARVNKADIEKAFIWFFKNYSYDWTIILKATAYYVDTFEKNNFLYMRNSQYFIRKQITGVNFESDLANYCEIILNNGHEEDITGLTEKVV
jgi:hypothetical protein